MKIKLLKAKHFWKNGENAVWLKSEKFNSKLFEEFKKKYESIKYSKKQYIQINGKTLLLFYKSKQDIFGRPITEITALQIDNKVKDIDMLYTYIKELIPNIFDDTLEYNITVSKSMIIRDRLALYYSLLFTLLLLVIYSLYLYIDRKKPIQNKIYNKLHNNIVESKSIQWKWNYFCNKYNDESVALCYKIFIKEKCEKREKFIYSYINFIRKSKNNSCVYLKNKDRNSEIIDIMSYDENLEKNINKNFFTEEKIENER